MRNCLGCSISEKMSKKSESRKEEALRARASTYGRVPLKDVVADCERRWFEATLKAAMSGDVTMQYLVGQMYCSGYGVAPDLKQGRIWLQKSAEVDKDARLLLASLAGGDMDVLSPLGDRGWLNYLKGIGMMAIECLCVRTSTHNLPVGRVAAGRLSWVVLFTSGGSVLRLPSIDVPPG